MDTRTMLVALIPSALSLITSIIYAYIALKKANQLPKDEAWEAALRILCANADNYMASDDFLKLYAELKFIKEHPDKLAGFATVEDAIGAYVKERNAGVAPLSAPQQHIDG